MEIGNIKFKAKRLDNKEWVEGSFVVMNIPALNKTTIGIVVEGGATLYEVDPSTVCQFTGLKDKEGKEIFENDLLYDEDSGIVSAIKWKRHICGYVYEKAGMFSTMRVYASHTSLLKIIGNKFDRKEGKE